MKAFVVAIVLFLFSSISGYGQEYRVLEAKKSFKDNGDRIRVGDFLDKHEVVIVREKGELTIDTKSPRNLKLTAGKHNVDSLIEILTAKYERHIDLSNQLRNKGLLDCKFNYQGMVVPGSNRIYESDRIAVLDNGVRSVDQNSSELVTLNWTNPDKAYQEGYLILLREAFNKGFFVAILETQTNSITFDPREYGHQFLLYTIMAEDCRASRPYKIEVRKSN